MVKTFLNKPVQVVYILYLGTCRISFVNSTRRTTGHPEVIPFRALLLN